MPRLVLTLTLVTLSAAACAQHTRQASSTRGADRGAPKTLTLMTSPSDLRRAMDEVAEARRAAEEADRAAEQEGYQRWLERCRQIREARERYNEEGVVIVVCGRSPVIGTMSVSRIPIMEATLSNQHPELDEGAIIKRHGDVLVVLRRGRLFTFTVGGGRLDSLAVAPDESESWNDELLVIQGTVTVVRYHHDGDGMAIALFDLDAAGGLRRRDTHHLRSNPYVSAGHHSARALGDRLLLFTSMPLAGHDDPDDWLPALGRGDGTNPKVPMAVIPKTRVFRPVDRLNQHAQAHALIGCRMAPSFSCDATVILGEELRAYYVSPAAAYAWSGPWTQSRSDRSIVYRFPLDGAPVTAVGVYGAPYGQLAFVEDQHHLNVTIVNDEGVRLLRTPLSSFTDGTADVAPGHYRSLANGTYLYANSRFVGPYLLAGISDGNGRDDMSVSVVHLERNRRFDLALSHSVDHIEPIGAHAVVIGRGEAGLGVTAISLSGTPGIVSSLQLPRARESEEYGSALLDRQDADRAGLLGVLIGPRGPDTPAATRIAVLRNQRLSFTTSGAITMEAALPPPDQGDTQTVEWSTMRPIFAGDRIFAVAGFTLVEGRLARGQIEVVRRIDLAPKPIAR